MHRVCVVLSSILLLASCAKTPAAPATATATAAADVALTASVTVPRPVSPSNNVQIRNVDQPVTLVIANAISTQPGGTYTFEVATDAGFATKVQTKDSVAEGSGGQTSVRLDALTPARDYYWHARITAGGTTGVFGAMWKFTVGPAVTVSAPVPIAPLTGAQTGARPALRVANAARTGPAGAIGYRFEIATSAAFSSLVTSATVGEGVNETGYIPPADLPVNATFFWRATATDASTNVSATSAVQSFTTSLAIDLSRVIVSYPGAPNPASWPQTATLIAVEQDGNASTGGVMCISFSTSHDWPTIPFLGDPDVQIYANQWYFANIGGQWYGGPAEYLREGRGFCKSGQGTNTIGPDGGWTEPMRSWRPRVGELVGYMMSTPARAGHRSIDERSNVILQPWRDSSLGSATAARIVR